MKTTQMLRKVLAPALMIQIALALTLTLALALFVRPAHAAQSSYSANGQAVNVEVLVNGSTAPLFSGPGGWDRHYFQAFKGLNYSLVVQNTTGERVGVLIAVDGLNVVNGLRSNLANDEAMYVLGPWERAEISGWRTSLNDVRRFVFVDEERSYAQRTGQANGDLGWIRVLSFRERRPIAWMPQPRIRDFKDEHRAVPYGDESSRTEEERAPSAGNAEPQAQGDRRSDGAAKAGGLKEQAGQLHSAPESNPGTGWGDQRWDPVQRTVFLAASRPSDQIILRYEYSSGLQALGIFPRRPRTWEREHGELGFAQAPRW
jgi:hypothetical protein